MRVNQTALHRGFPKQMRTARIKETHLEVLAGTTATTGKTGFVIDVGSLEMTDVDEVFSA